MKKFIGLFLAAAVLCMVFPSTVFADARTLRSYTDMGEFVYVDTQLGVECRANARWAINQLRICVQMTAPKSDVTRMLRTEAQFTIFWIGDGRSGSIHNTVPAEADRFGGGFATDILTIIPEATLKARFANYITSEVRFYADDVLVCECTFDKMAYAGLYND